MHSDVVLLEAGEKDIGVDEVRTLVAEAQKYPSDGDRRCFIIDGADHLTGPAANALLKTLEEPPAASRFFLIAESAEYVLPTIRSRCGRIRYHPLPEPFVLSVLHQHDSDAKALVYARMGEGSVGRAIYYWGSGRLALRDQVMKLLHAAVERDWPSVFSLVDSLEKDVPLALKFLDQVLHDVLIARVDLGRVINADCVDGLAVMEKKVPVTVWSQLARRVRALQVQYRTSRLYLPFQIKTILIESFI
jgi:DNA polymerase-3 subunit delta'